MLEPSRERVGTTMEDRSGPLLRHRSEGFVMPRSGRRPGPLALLVAVLAIVLAACAGTASPTVPAGATGSTLPAATATPVPSASANASESPTPAATTAYPATLTDD